MKRVIQWALAVLLVVGSAAPAFAKKCEGVSMPDSITVGGETLLLNGLGVREATIFSVNVYVAGLYVTEKSSNGARLAASNTPKQLVLDFVRDVDRSKITDAYREGFKKAAGGSYSGHKSKVDKLLGWMSDTEEGDKHVYTYVPDRGLTIEVKGQKKGTIQGAEFAEIFYKIWLGDNPPNKGLKRGLLGGKCG